MAVGGCRVPHRHRLALGHQMPGGKPEVLTFPCSVWLLIEALTRFIGKLPAPLGYSPRLSRTTPALWESPKVVLFMLRVLGSPGLV